MNPTCGGGGANGKRVVRWVASVLGVSLVVIAIVAVARNAPTLDHLKLAVAHPDWRLLLAGLVCALANIAACGGLFHALVKRHGRVGLFEMQMLVVVSALLNYAPLRPGLVGRVAYQRLVGGITVRRSTLALVEAAIICAASIGWLALAAAVAGVWHERLLGGVMAAVPLLGALVMTTLTQRPWMIYSEAIFWRWIDLLAWTGRYWCVFALVGVDLDIESAAIAACVGSAASLLPFVGNGLGVREWAIGLAGPALSRWPTDMGLAADLLNRAIDLVTVVPLGLLALPICVRRMRTALLAADRAPDAK